MLSLEIRVASLKDVIELRGINTALLPEIVERSYAIGARLVAHVDSADDIDRLVRAGVHISAPLNTRITKGLTADDLRLSDATIAEMKRGGTIIIPTLAVTRYHLRAKLNHRDPLHGVIRDNLARLKAAEVPILAGSDLFYGSVIDEVVALTQTGVFSTLELLLMATRTTLKALCRDHCIGLFKEAGEASLVAYESNPLKSLKALRKPSLAIKQGELIAR